ncbi:MAG: hypothetical protein HC890_05610 [Chloroflexaceae bacterium]|nr:hypothetical protein [Chloroflexaceae bacterium]
MPALTIFYDPTTSATAAASGNGTVYGPPTDVATAAAGPIRANLDYQASLFYSNGRRVNQSLVDALAAFDAAGNADGLSFAQRSAIDAAVCGLQILDTLDTSLTGIGTLAASETPTAGYNLPNNAIREISLLDGRQLQNLTSDYNPVTGVSSLNPRLNLELEQRQPLEVRATVLDLDLLRGATADGTNAPQEYMIPNSGLIYASRNDALADASDVNPTVANTSQPGVAAADHLVDPTRRQSAIILVNGQRLWREQEFRTEERGFTLATNLAAYIKAAPFTVNGDASITGGFNPHLDNINNEQLEFTDAFVASNFAQFYGRSNLNPNYACRMDDPRLPSGSCASNAVADQWRPANVLSDSLTLLSTSFREGFRNEGNYDLQNHRPDQIADPDADGTTDVSTAAAINVARLNNGFWNNDFAVSGLTSGLLFDPDGPGALLEATHADATYQTDSPPLPLPAGYLGSSYFNNFVTPVQRRVNFDEYLMEYCPRLPHICLPPPRIGLSIVPGRLRRRL